MNIIILTGRNAKARTISLTPARLAMLGAGLLLVPLLLAALFFYVALFHAADIKHPYLQSLILSAQQEQASKNRVFLQDNLNAMGIKLGELHAQMTRMEALGERLARLAGIKKNEFNFDQPPARGGASTLPQEGFTTKEFQQYLEQLALRMEGKVDQLGALETILLQQNLRKLASPSYAPVEAGWNSSSFGVRIDPFTGQRAMHEGIDFIAEVGAPILAAANGVVVLSEYHPGYGKLVDIDHGNGLLTRYAHASKLLVKNGDVVKRGQKIAEVGSTGRSTGPHLHFEVRYNGAPQNPAKYLQPPG